MKKVFIIKLVVALLFVANIKATANYSLQFDSLSCLQIEGKITNVEEGNGECTVELISANEVVEEIVLKEGKFKFKFVLQKNKFYSIRLSKVGFITKLVSVNTEILTESEGIHVFKFETGLITAAIASKLNPDIIDFPATIIQYDYEMDTFVHNAQYTAYIKRELYKSGPVKAPKLKPVYVLNTEDLAYQSR
jgi:hypothetical protein